jgi:antitoxin component YwqK of YwqJK toxin-antitoxin module
MPGDLPTPVGETEGGQATAEGTSNERTTESVDSSRPATLPEGAASEAAPAPGDGQLQAEVVSERYPNRKLKIERHVVQDAERNYVNHGPWTMWTPEGTMIAKGRFEWGKRQGQWSRLYTDINDERIAGQHTRQFSTPFAGIADFSDDKLHGAWRIIDAKQRDVRSWEFRHGKLHGKSVAWFPNGRKQSEMYFEDGMIAGTSLEWDSNGRQLARVTYKDGRSSLPYSKTYATGEKRFEGQYLSPRQIFKAKIDYWNGFVDIELSKKEGEPKRHGKWHEWHQNGGKKFEGDFEEDKPTSRHTWWFPNGQKRAEGEFKNGKEQGHWTWWHENGLKHLDGYFQNGVQTGTWVRWKPDGKVQEVQEHHLGTAKTGEPKTVTNDAQPQELPEVDTMPTDDSPTPGVPAPSMRRLTPRPLPSPQPQAQQPLRRISR